MRVLLTSHQPFHQGIGGTNVYRLYDRLLAAGHEVRVFLAGAIRESKRETRTIVCAPNNPAAEFAHELPTLYTEPFERHSFPSMNDQDLGEYREALRAGFDEEIAFFDPHIVHVQHLWIDGHLALESGAPYVVSAYTHELAALDADERFTRYVRETAENAGRILVNDSWLARELERRFELSPDLFGAQNLNVDDLIQVYRGVSEARFGTA
jgi:hypothetical protein